MLDVFCIGANAPALPGGFILSPSATLRVAGPSLLGPVLADGERMKPTPQPDTDRGPSCASRSILEPEAPPEA